MITKWYGYKDQHGILYLDEYLNIENFTQQKGVAIKNFYGPFQADTYPEAVKILFKLAENKEP